VKREREREGGKESEGGKEWERAGGKGCGRKGGWKCPLVAHENEKEG